MNAKDQEVLKKKTPSLGRAAPAAEAKAPVPEAGVKLQQGATADMQHNVGNSGLKDLLSEQKPKGAAKDPARMGPDELRAQAKTDAEELSKKSGGHAAKKPAAHGEGAELDEKQKSVLDAEAARKKKDAEAAKQKAQADEAKHAREKAKKPATKLAGVQADAAHADPKAKAAKPAVDKKAAKKKAADPVAGHEGPAAAGKDHAAKTAVKVDAKKEAGKKKVVAKESDAEHAKAKADVAKTLVGKQQKDVGEVGKAAKAKLAETGKRAADKKIAAGHAEKKAEDVESRTKVAGAAHLPKSPGTKAAKPEVAQAEAGKKGAPGKGSPQAAAAGHDAKGGAADAKAHAKAEPHAKKVEQTEVAKQRAEEKVVEVKGRKLEAEAKVEAEPDSAKKASHAKEAEVHGAAEKAADEHVKKKVEEVDAVQAAKELDKSIEEVTRASDLEAHDGEEITLVGIYVPRPAEAGGPQLGHVSVMIGDQEVRLGKEVRGTAEILRLAGEKVVVTGKLDLKKQPGQAVDPSRRDKPVLTGFRSPHRR